MSLFPFQRLLVVIIIGLGALDTRLNNICCVCCCCFTGVVETRKALRKGGVSVKTYGTP